MRRKTDGGFATIWLVMILTGLMTLLLVITEAASGFAASSIGENLCVSAGRSVLSEYNKQLFDRYGIFALRAGDERLSSMGSYYIGCGLGNDSGLLNMELAECRVSGEEYPGLSYQLLMAQIRPLGTAMGIQSIMDENSLTGVISGLTGVSEMADSLEGSQIGCLEELNSAGDVVSGDGSADPAADNVSAGEELLHDYEEAADPDLEGSDGAVLSAALKGELPSAVLGIDPTWSLLLSGGAADISADAVAAGEYILNICSNFLKRGDKCLLNGEAEYILYGHDSDKANERAVKLSIFEIRSAVDLAEIYSDSGAMAEINAEALAFAPVPQPVAAFAIASVRAAAQALADVDTLFSGGKVPFFKGGKGGSYEDYLRVLLVFLPQKNKLIRLMDVMQMNLSEKEGVPFAFQDFCYGIRVESRFEKRVHILGLKHFEKRRGNISVVTQYQ